MNPSSISSRAMLCNVSLSLPGQTKQDKENTRKFLSDNHAQEGAGKWSTVLWPEEATKVPKSIGGKLRAKIEFISGPYFVKGLRILPSGLYMQAMKEGREALPEFEAAVHESVARMDEWIHTMRMKANGLFRRELYPETPEQFKAMFSLDVSIMPLPDESNFLLLQLAQECIDEERQKYQATLDSTIQSHEAELFDKMIEPVFNCAKLLARFEKGEKPKVYDTLLGNIDRIVKALPHLNLTGNAQLEELRSMAQELTSSVTTDELRTSDAVRAKTRQAADAILERMKGYMV